MSDNIDKIISLVSEINAYSEDANTKIFNEFQENLYLDLAPNQIILINLVKEKPGSSIGELAEKMKVTSSAIGQIIAKLEKNNLIKREINPSNRREVNVFLDAEGRKYFEVKERLRKDIVNKYYSQLSFEELVTLRDIVKKLNQIVNDN